MSLPAAGLLTAIGESALATTQPLLDEREQAAAALKRYIDFGGKASGGPGDIACGQWLEGELAGLGFQVERQSFSAPFFDVEKAELRCGSSSAVVIPQAIVVLTGADGVSGKLAVVEPWSAQSDLAGRVALIPLPYGRWSSATAPAIRQPVAAALTAGAAAVVMITNGPTGEAITLNADGREPMFNKPVAILAPKDADPFLHAAAQGALGRLVVSGRGGRRATFNLIARRERGHGRWLVVSTPRSGWHVCAGERGPGLAVWLMLARWLTHINAPVDLAFVCNSGHEYENLGATHVLDTAAPPTAKTALWLHLGANVAARDWHELGSRLMPLPSADPQRFLVTSPALVELCRRSFQSQPGLEQPYSASVGSAGELTHILAAGYPAVAGVFGAHRFHHAPSDDDRCVSSDLVVAAYEGFRELIRGVGVAG